MSKRRAAVSMGLVLVAATGVTATQAHAQRQAVAQPVSTLREALIKHEIPLERGAPADLDRPLPSYAIDDSPDLFVIGSDVGDSLRVSAFDRRTRAWSHVWLERSRQRAPSWDVGSLRNIHHTEQRILLDTHQSPSAGTVIVLSRSLVPVTTLAGWVVRALPTGTVVYQRASVHFAPTHALELWTWNPETGRDVQLYPVEPADSVRRAYVDTVRSIYQRVGKAWFRQHNHHMDPERFDSRLATSVVASPSGRELTFLVRYGGGEGTAAERRRSTLSCDAAASEHRTPDVSNSTLACVVRHGIGSGRAVDADSTETGDGEARSMPRELGRVEFRCAPNG